MVGAILVVVLLVRAQVVTAGILVALLPLAIGELSEELDVQDRTTF